MSQLNLIRESINEGVIDAQSRASGAALKVTALSERVKALIVVAGALLINFIWVAYADAQKGCGNQAADTLVGFIDSAAKFMIVIGGAAALLMFAVGAFMIIVGGTGERVQKGMKMVKNAVIGLIILAAGFFIKVVVVEFVGGATSGEGSNNCLPSGAR